MLFKSVCAMISQRVDYELKTLWCLFGTILDLHDPPLPRTRRRDRTWNTWSLFHINLVNAMIHLEHAVETSRIHCWCQKSRVWLLLIRQRRAGKSHLFSTKHHFRRQAISKVAMSFFPGSTNSHSRLWCHANTTLISNSLKGIYGIYIYIIKHPLKKEQAYAHIKKKNKVVKICKNDIAKMLRSPTLHNCWIYFEVGHSCRL